MLPPTLFPGSTLLAGPKHSTSTPFSVAVAVPLNVDMKEGPFVPNPVSDLAVKTLFGPQMEEDVDLCTRLHSLLPFTLQMVNPLTSPVTVHLKIKVPPGQVGGGPVSCPATSPGEKIRTFTTQVSIYIFIHKANQGSFSFLSKGGGKMRLYRFFEGQAYSCTKHVAN